MTWPKKFVNVLPMSRILGIALLIGYTLPTWSWQQTSNRPVFTGSWQLDLAKSKKDGKDDLLWKIVHDPKAGDISIEEVSGGKTVCSAKCAIGKPCEYDDGGKKMGAMTYFLDTTLVQMRSAADNSSVIKRQLKMNEDGTLEVQVMTITPVDKTEVLVFNKQKTDAAAK